VENNDKDEYMVNLPEEVATFHDLLYEPTEESATIRIKALVATGKAGEAEALLNSFSVSKMMCSKPVIQKIVSHRSCF
jgi:hypothetical protein